MATNPQLNNAYRQQRQRLLAILTAAAQQAFLQGRQNERSAIEALIALVQSGQAAMVRLVDGYMALATGQQPLGLPTAPYTITALRADPLKTYSQPFAALTVALQNGEPLTAALVSGQARLGKLVSTDLQLAQTHSARAWMTSPGSGVYGWQRVADATACSLCQSAAGQTYYTSDLMPIHEHCGCGVEPITEGSPKLSAIDASVRVVTGDIGPRLMAADWGGE